MTRISAHKKIKASRQILLVFALTFMSFFVHAENLKKIVDLEGSWKFTIGDDPAWSAPGYDDQDWDFISVPRSWENDGFVGYDGYAWYRKSFTVSKEINNKAPILILGIIDDVDEVFLNGILIGHSGIMPPQVTTAHTQLRKYPIPVELLNLDGKNTIAVRVYDEYNRGGIYAGPVGIFYDKDSEHLSINLAGYWDFKPRFKHKRSKQTLYNQNENQIYVPAYWENYGYPKLDGTASYSRSFDATAIPTDQTMMLVLGYIDDLDQVFINDVALELIDELKRKYNEARYKDNGFRADEIPSGVLNLNSENQIKVIITDTGGLGGIYEGPIGLITKTKYRELNIDRKSMEFNFWDDIWNEIFK